VFEEIERIRGIRLNGNQMTLVRQNLLRQYELDSRDNRYLLSQISRTYEDGNAAAVASVIDVPGRIQGLTGDALQQAARTYLDTGNYVRVTLLPAAQ
jgi:predicted Zn-dependent peptidase